MKKLLILVLTLVLTAALFTGCGCTNQNRPEMTTPTGQPTTMPTMPATMPSTAPTTEATRPTTEATMDTAIPDETSSGIMESTVPETRQQSRIK